MSEPTPRISIVTPSDQQGRYLEQTVQSVLGQGYENLEYIVVDGGSTDESRLILERYAERLAWWCSEPDDGQTHAINKGLRQATGDIVAYLNSDDILLPGALASVAQAFDDLTVQATTISRSSTPLFIPSPMLTC